MALSEGDWVGAGLSVVSMVPYLGDALAKPLKGGRAAAKVARLAQKLERLKDKAKKLGELVDKAKQRVKQLLKKKRGGPPEPPAPKKPENPGDGGHVPKVKPQISRQKQSSHVKGTPEYKNRVKQGKPTSAFDNWEDAEKYTQEAWEKGKPVPGQPNKRDYDFGHPVGTGPNGGTQSIVRVHQDQAGRIHGHPKGPEN
jgi:hypothetical protein